MPSFRRKSAEAAAARRPSCDYKTLLALVLSVVLELVSLRRTPLHVKTMNNKHTHTFLAVDVDARELTMRRMAEMDRFEFAN